jgi:hypothetical protein
MTIAPSPTLPTGPIEHPAMDHAALRAEGVRLLGRYAGAQWTDFNTGDPGVTILEQLCYAITDLAYRIDHPMADLLAGIDTTTALPGPATILTGDPVTEADLHRLVLDVEGVDDARIAALVEPRAEVYHHRGSGELRLEIDPADIDAPAVALSGLRRVCMHAREGASPAATRAAVHARLHAHRGLCFDFTVDEIVAHTIWLTTSVEIGPVEDPTELLTDILERLGDHLAPPSPFTSRADALADGRPLDELFEGPRLAHGHVLGPLPPKRRSVRASDLIHVLMDVPAVRAVRSLVMGGTPHESEKWLLVIPPDTLPVLAVDSTITLLRAGLPVHADPADARARLAARRQAARARAPSPDNRDLTPPPGRDRRLARYTSIRDQLPAVYGVGGLGLPASASPHRQAQALQLAAYLHIFDQLLANEFAQLAHAGALLSPAPGAPRTYFAQPATDPRIGGYALVRPPVDAPDHAAWLARRVDDAADPHARRQRFLSHLLARFAEQLGDYAQLGPAHPGDALVADREAFLRQYPRLSGARGSGHDILADEPSGLEQRLRFKLGLPATGGFHLVEHILLRPIPEDDHQRGDPAVPLLTHVGEADPWSMQVSYVFVEDEATAMARAMTEDAPETPFERLVIETLLAETPAHIRPHLRWFSDAEDSTDWTDFTAAWAAFRAQQRAYRAARLSGLQLDELVHQRFRDARDRVIDLLGFGRTYPLRDIALPSQLVVIPGASAVILLPFSQVGVIYSLHDARTGVAIVGDKVRRAGTDDRLELVAAAIAADSDFRVLATRPASGPTTPAREAWLHGVVQVRLGVDPSVLATIEKSIPLLDPAVDDPQPGHARLADHGQSVTVMVFLSQEGVTYELIDDADHTRILSEKVEVGDSGDIKLITLPMLEDVDIRVRGSKSVGDPEDPDTRTALLTVVLPLRVRADRSPPVALIEAPPLAHDGSAAAWIFDKSQQSATYQLWRRKIRDAEFVYIDPPESALTVLDGDRSIRVAAAAPPLPFTDFTAVSDPATGTGGGLELPPGAFAEDTRLVVTATKRHRRSPGSDAFIESTVVLTDELAALVRPDQGPALRLRFVLTGEATTDQVQLLGGQPGVFYTLLVDGQPIGPPAYFHQRSDVTPSADKGIDELRIEGDFVVLDVDDSEPNQPPPPPPITITPLPVGAVLQVHARRATTDLTAPLTRVATVVGVPAVHVPDMAYAGQSTPVEVLQPDAADHFSLLRDGALVDEADGGGVVVLNTGPLKWDSRVQLVAVRKSTDELVVERRLDVALNIDN